MHLVRKEMLEVRKSLCYKKNFQEILLKKIVKESSKKENY